MSERRKMKTITAVIEYAGDNYSAYVNGFDGIAASGATLDEIKGNLSGAVEAYIEACRDLGCELPEDLSGASLRIDLKPGLSAEQLDARLLRDFREMSRKQLISVIIKNPNIIDRIVLRLNLVGQIIALFNPADEG